MDLHIPESSQQSTLRLCLCSEASDESPVTSRSLLVRGPKRHTTRGARCQDGQRREASLCAGIGSGDMVEEAPITVGEGAKFTANEERVCTSDGYCWYTSGP